MSGIPDNLPTPPPAAAAAAPAPAAAAAAAAASDASPLAALRAHPQFDALRRLVQTNPEQLQAVLAQIGAQTPELLQAINANQNEFIAMMNEPVTSAPAASPTPAAAAGTPPAPGGGLPGGLGGLMGGMANPADIAGLLNNLTPQQRNDMAQAMGMTPQQLEATTQMIQNMPPEAMAQIAAQMGGAGGPGGMGGGGGGAPPGAHVIQLTQEDMESVNRLTALGFDRNEAAQAFLACDKNESLAANLLMDGGFGGMDDGFGGGGGGGGDPSGGL